MKKNAKKLSKWIWLSLFAVSLVLTSWLQTKDAEAACSHTYRWVTMKQPTCVATGYRNYTCSKCGHTKSSATLEKVPNHTWNRSAATCTAAKKCTKCGTVGQSATGHSWDRSAATCTAAKKCTKCGTVGQSATGHSYSWVTMKEPTCTETGYRNYTCSKCNHVQSSATLEKVPNHTWDRSAATCTAAKKCTRCGTVGQKATGHTWDRSAATCTAAKKCTKCGTVGQKATGHSYSWVTMKEPTCTETGYRNNKCTNAGCTSVINSATLDKIPHSCNINAATCTTDRVCNVCKAVVEKAKGHHVVTVETAPTCYSAGSSVTKCDRSGCTYSVGATTIPPYQHTMVKDTNKSVAATCTAAGKLVQYCKTSGCTYTTTTQLAKLEHAYTNYVEVIAPTCMADGYTKAKCKCGLWGTFNYTKATGHTEDTSVGPQNKDGVHNVYCKNCKTWYAGEHNMVTYTLTDTKGNLIGSHIKICADSVNSLKNRCGYKEYTIEYDQCCRHHLKNKVYSIEYSYGNNNSFLKRYVMEADCKVCKNKVTAKMELEPVAQGTWGNIHDAGVSIFVDQAIGLVPGVSTLYDLYGVALEISDVVALCKKYEAETGNSSYRMVQVTGAGIEYTKLEENIAEDFARFLDNGNLEWKFEQGDKSIQKLVYTDK